MHIALRGDKLHVWKKVLQSSWNRTMNWTPPEGTEDRSVCRMHDEMKQNIPEEIRPFHILGQSLVSTQILRKLSAYKLQASFVIIESETPVRICNLPGLHEWSDCLWDIGTPICLVKNLWNQFWWKVLRLILVAIPVDICLPMLWTSCQAEFKYQTELDC